MEGMGPPSRTGPGGPARPSSSPPPPPRPPPSRPGLGVCAASGFGADRGRGPTGPARPSSSPPPPPRRRTRCRPGPARNWPGGRRGRGQRTRAGDSETEAHLGLARGSCRSPVVASRCPVPRCRPGRRPARGEQPVATDMKICDTMRELSATVLRVFRGKGQLPSYPIIVSAHRPVGPAGPAAARPFPTPPRPRPARRAQPTPPPHARPTTRTLLQSRAWPGKGPVRRVSHHWPRRASALSPGRQPVWQQTSDRARAARPRLSEQSRRFHGPLRGGSASDLP